MQTRDGRKLKHDVLETIRLRAVRQVEAGERYSARYSDGCSLAEAKRNAGDLSYITCDNRDGSRVHSIQKREWHRTILGWISQS